MCLGRCFSDIGSGTVRGLLLGLLQEYRPSLIVNFQEKTFVQYYEICIGAAILPISSDMFLAECDTEIPAKMPDGDVIRGLKCVGDYLVLRRMDEWEMATPTRQVTDLLEEDANGISSTVQIHEKSKIMYLNLTLLLNHESCGWCFEPRDGKGFSCLNTAHSKLVKRGIVTFCLVIALQKSCTHYTKKSFSIQLARLSEAGYPPYLLRCVAEALRRKEES